SRSIREARIEVPLRRIEELQRIWRGREDLLDARPLRRELRERDARVLVELAEQVLAVDRVERTAKKILPIEAEPAELVLLTVDHLRDEVLGRAIAEVVEHLPKSPNRAGPRDREAVLGELEMRRVVEVDRELVGHEVADQRPRSQLLEQVAKRLR